MSSINKDEIEKFEKIAEQWWDLNGMFKPLHKLNPVRIKYITQQICEKYGLDFSSAKPLEGVNILDVGCGGGLVAEKLDFLGARVTALDPSYKNIQIAKINQKKTNSKVNYINEKIEDFKDSFQVVLNLEVIEHVDNPKEFLSCVANCVEERGMLFLSTINRNIKSLLLAKFAAEYILNWLPKGTHDWRKFLKPSELYELLPEGMFALVEQVGVKYNIMNSKFVLSDDLAQNYISCLVKG